MYSYRGHQLIEHRGSDLGFSSSVIRAPNDNLGIVLLNNDGLAYLPLEAIKWRLLDEINVRAALPSAPLVDWFTRQVRLLPLNLRS